MSQPNVPDEIYRQQLEVQRLRRIVYGQNDVPAPPEMVQELAAAERRLRELEREREKAPDPGRGVLLDTKKRDGLLGRLTTKLEARFELRMAQVPTAIAHLLDPEKDPLVTCWVQNTSQEAAEIRRVRVSAFVDSYSAHAVQTLELKPGQEGEFKLLPTFFPEKVRALNELTRASLNLVVDDLDSGKVELHVTRPLWLLAKTTAPLKVQDPATGAWKDLTNYLGAFVTPNAPPVISFLRTVARRHPRGQLVGYQIAKEEVTEQVRAAFYALKSKAGITYINSVIDFTPGWGAANQRVRLPTECLSDKSANCLDGTLLFASLLEAMSLSPAIVIVPGHAFVGWEPWSDRAEDWKFLETTMIGTSTFEEAHAAAEHTAKTYREEAKLLDDSRLFTLWPVRSLRVENITPLE